LRGKDGRNEKKGKEKKKGKKEKVEERSMVREKRKELSEFVSPEKISYSYANAKMHAIIHGASASGAQRPPDPFPGLCPWTPLEDLFSRPHYFTPSNLKS